MQIKVGQKFKCRKDFINDEGITLFKEGQYYSCHIMDSLTNSVGDHITFAYMSGSEFYTYFEYADKDLFVEEKEDNVNHPKHYTSHPSGIECITITRHYCFAIGNAIKYLWRAGLKKDASLEDKQKEIEDLEKAIWYIKDRIKQLKDDTA